MKKLTTLCIVHKDRKVLLGMKKRGFGTGRWNGFGGKVEGTESIVDAAKRELLEESGLIALNILPIAVMSFEIQNTKEDIEMHLFKVTEYQGQIVESEEMLPQWFVEDKIPFDHMWPDDRSWMPYFLKNKKFTGKFKFLDYNTIIGHEIIESSV